MLWQIFHESSNNDRPPVQLMILLTLREQEADMDPLAKERQILADAVAALRRNVVLKAKILHTPKVDGLFRPDVLLEIVFSGQRQLFVVEVKAVDRNIAVGQI